MKFGSSDFVFFAHRSSILFRHEPTVRDRGDVVVGVFFGSLGQLHLFPWQVLVGNQAERMRNEVQPRAALIVGAHDNAGVLKEKRDSGRAAAVRGDGMEEREGEGERGSVTGESWEERRVRAWLREKEEQRSVRKGAKEPELVV